MYLVSIYFDEKTNKTIQGLIDKVARKTGNNFMIAGKVPPHITVSAFETKHEEEIMGRLRTVARIGLAKTNPYTELALYELEK